ncbi:MAG: DNA (cytosine-5-)-methyltransferase [Bacillota bacterium]
MIKKENSKLKVASLFAGIGGICLGCKQAGMDVIWANEKDSNAAITYKHNHKETQLIVGDIKKVDVKTMPDFDVLTAGFPCQSFSIAGKQRGFNDSRGNLFFEIERVIREKMPKVLFLENVANLVEHDHGRTFLVIYNTLVEYGYFIKYKVMNAKDYANIPQQRNRIFIVAFLDQRLSDTFEFPNEVELTNNVFDIIDRSEKHDDCYYYNESHPKYNQLIKFMQDDMAVYRFTDYGISKQKENICPTLLAAMGTMKDRIPIIKDDFGIRKLTPYECLALQGFPKDFQFKGISMNAAYKQCGNSVVVPVIRRIAEQIKNVIE